MRKKPRKQKSRSRARAECDTLFSKLIRERDGHCLKCRGSDSLQCAHVISRRYLATRCDRLNAITLCRGCHVYFTHRPLEWDLFIGCFMLQDDLEAIKRRALEGPTPDWFELLENLKANGLNPPPS